jgi:hypothetical protein
MGMALALALVLVAGSVSFADSTSALNPAKKPVTPADNPAFKKFLEDGGRMEFLGNAYGVDGWLLVHKDNKITTIYATPDGGLVKGKLFDPNGQPVTVQQVQAYEARMNGAQGAVPGAEKGGASKAETVYAKVEKANWVRVGSKDAPYMYIFVNVGCKPCQELWGKLQPSVKEGKLQVRIIPFGEKPENRMGGAALLSADKPGDAWQAFIDGKVDALGKDKVRGDTLKEIDANTDLVNAVNIPAPYPFTIYRKLTDGTITAIAGLPDNMMVVQADLMKNN